MSRPVWVVMTVVLPALQGAECRAEVETKLQHAIELHCPGEESLQWQSSSDEPTLVDPEKLYDGTCEIRVAGSPAGYAIEARLETSVLIRGSHDFVHLVDWKHGFTDWQPLSSSSNGYRVPKFEKLSGNNFPPSGSEEIKRAVLFETGETELDWIGQDKECKTVTDHPCTIEPSRVHFRAGEGEKSVIFKALLAPSPACD